MADYFLGIRIPSGFLVGILVRPVIFRVARLDAIMFWLAL